MLALAFAALPGREQPAHALFCLLSVFPLVRISGTESSDAWIFVGLYLALEAAKMDQGFQTADRAGQ